MVETVTIVKAEAEPSLQDQAIAMGIDPTTIDPTAPAQSADEKILGKFKTTEELAKAYRELEQKLGKGATPNAEADEAEVELPSDSETVEGESVEDEPEAEEKTDEEKAKEELEKRGLDFAKFTQVYEENGALTEESYKELEDAGIPKELVDQFIQGQEAVRELTRQSVFAEAGGEDNYWSMTEWAARNWSEAEIDQFNAAVDGQDRLAAATAVKGLKARFEAEVGREPARTVGGRKSAANSTVYTSVAQMQKDMADPRYKTDPVYRAKVEAKVGRSNIL